MAVGKAEPKPGKQSGGVIHLNMIHTQALEERYTQEAHALPRTQVALREISRGGARQIPGRQHRNPLRWRESSSPNAPRCASHLIRATNGTCAEAERPLA